MYNIEQISGNRGQVSTQCDSTNSVHTVHDKPPEHLDEKCSGMMQKNNWTETRIYIRETNYKRQTEGDLPPQAR